MILMKSQKLSVDHLNIAWGDMWVAAVQTIRHLAVNPQTVRSTVKERIKNVTTLA